MKSLRFAFVCCRPKAAGFASGPSFIYRCQNIALALRSAGHHVELAHYSKFAPSQPFDMVVFHRPHYSFSFRLHLRRLRNAGTLCVADFDDLVFDPSYAQFSPGVVNQQVSLKQTEKNFSSHAKALALFNYASVSTTPLASDMQQSHGLEPWFIPNAVHVSWRQSEQQDERSIALDIGQKPERPTFTYFPGTRSHDRDFAMIREPLADFLAQHKEVQLQITGELANEAALNSFDSKQLLRFPKQQFQDYRQHVSASWVNLAPLEDTAFNQRKSALKVIEASYFEAPTLATPIPDMQRLHEAGAVLVDSDKDSWYQAMCDALHAQKARFTANATAPTPALRAKILAQADIHRIALSLLQHADSPAQADKVSR